MPDLKAPSEPLSAYRIFHAHQSSELECFVEGFLGARLAKLPPGRSGVDACANRMGLPNGEIWLCSYKRPVTITFPESAYLRVQFSAAGSGTTHFRGKVLPITAARACISGGDADIEFGENFQQLVWRVSCAALKQKLAAITGRSIARDLIFDPQLDLTSPGGASAAKLLDVMVTTGSLGPTPAISLALAELEQAFIVLLLTTAAITGRSMLYRTPSGCASWQVRRAEEYIAANLDHPMTIEDLVDATNVPARTLFRTFRQYRGVSPLAAVQRMRLEKARQVLECATDDATVTDIAFRCGFSDLSHFSRTYRRAFGESPSLTLKRRSTAFDLNG